jgi:hypothetical protein
MFSFFPSLIVRLDGAPLNVDVPPILVKHEGFIARRRVGDISRFRKAGNWSRLVGIGISVVTGVLPSEACARENPRRAAPL